MTSIDWQQAATDLAPIECISDRALVRQSPPYNAQNGAYIDPPGPLEKGIPSIYYIAPPAPAWSSAATRATRSTASWRW